MRWLSRVAVFLAALSVCYCLAEGLASVAFASSDASISLMIFGVDSLIEVTSSCLVLWRLLGRNVSLKEERLVVKIMGSLLLLLATAAMAASIIALVRHESPETSIPTIVISSISFVLLSILYVLKRMLAKKLKSSVLASDATCSFACARLSLVLLVGSVLFRTVPGVWWVDAAAAMVLSLFFAKEGVDMLKHAMSPHFQGGGCGCG